MLSFLAKAVFSGTMVALIATIAKRYPGWGGLLASLPLTSLLAITLLWVDTRDTAKVEALSWSINLFILPSLPIFVALPLMLRHGVGFLVAMAIAIAATLMLYALVFWALPKLGFTM